MRALMLNERDLAHPLAGGVEVHLEEAFGRLSRDHGIATTVLCAGFPGASGEEERHGIRYVRLGNSRFEYYALLPRRVRKEVAGGGYSVLVENLCKLVFASPLYLRGLPGVGLVHHLFGTSAFRQVAAPIAAAVLASESLLPIFYRSWPMVAVSPSTRDDLVRRGLSADRVRVIPNGLDHERYRPDPGTQPEPGRVVFVGRLEHYKGLDVLRDAWPQVRAACPGARLEILGSGTATDALRGALGESSGVTLHGFVSEEEKVTWLRRACVVVQPSRKEGWGLTVMEANACGAPVVASDVPGLRDSVRHGVTGVLVPAGDPMRLGAAIGRVLSDGLERSMLARGALQWAGRFGWDAVANELARVLRAAANRADIPDTYDFFSGVSARIGSGATA